MAAVGVGIAVSKISSFRYLIKLMNKTQTVGVALLRRSGVGDSSTCPFPLHSIY
jgi:hypothetical protein